MLVYNSVFREVSFAVCQQTAAQPSHLVHSYDGEFVEKPFLWPLVWLNIKATRSYFFVTFPKKKCIPAPFVILILLVADLMISSRVWR